MAVKPLLPLPVPLMPIRFLPLSVKVLAGLLASGLAADPVFLAMIVFWPVQWFGVTDLLLSTVSVHVTIDRRFGTQPVTGSNHEHL
jgi:hypothetical protein